MNSKLWGRLVGGVLCQHVVAVVSLCSVGVHVAKSHAQQVDLTFQRSGRTLVVMGTSYKDEVTLSVQGGLFRFYYRVHDADPNYVNHYESRSGVSTIRFYGFEGDDRFSHQNGPPFHGKPSPDVPRLELFGGPGSDDLHGSNYNDWLVGGESSLKDELFGHRGHDVLQASDGVQHSLHGGVGNDVLCVGSGYHFLYGNNGDDVLFTGPTSNRIVQPGNGNDRLIDGRCTDAPWTVAGDWDGDGITQLGTFAFERGVFVLPGAESAYVEFGLPNGDWPVVGDWDGDGVDEVGIYRRGKFFLDVGLPGYGPDGSEEHSGVAFGLIGDVPVIGDWDGDGVDDVGTRRNGTFYLDEGERGWTGVTSGEWPGHNFGWWSDLPLVADWNGDGIDDLGVVRNSGGQAEIFPDVGDRGYHGEHIVPFFLGPNVNWPLLGDWNGDGRTDMAVLRGNYLYFDDGDIGFGNSYADVVGFPIGT